MAMVIKNNMQSVNTLNTLNTNNSELAKSLKKVSSGMRINSAADGASEYAIGKGMEVLVRALDADIDNTKTGRNLVNTAEGGIQDIINLLREMKEKAIDSANDHNSDIDRATIQKDFSGRMENITDIAATTNYNGRLLLNGDYAEPCEKMVHLSIPHYTTRQITVGPPSISVIPNGKGAYSIIQNNSISDLMLNCTPVPNTGTKSTGWNSYRTYQPDLGLSYVGTYATSWSWPQAMGLTGSTTQKNQLAVKADFSGVNLNGGTFPTALDGQGFTVICGGCDQYINFKFDANSTTSSVSRPSSQRLEYTIGVQNVTSASDLAQAIFDGVNDPSTYSIREQSKYNPVDPDSSDNVLLDGNHQVRFAKDPSGTGYVFLKDYSPAIGFIASGTVVDMTTNPNDVPLGTTIVTGPTTYTLTSAVDYEERDELQHIEGRPLIIHTGAKANQNLRVFINSMHPIALGINRASVDTRPNAVRSLEIIDNALQYALNENTRMGAYQARLNETEETLVAAEENTTASMSTVEDADMAKEMQIYTKNSVLTQVAQSMLTKSNQNASSVLDLLQ